MQKIKMSVCWMFMILVGCRLSHATQSQSTCTCNNQLKTFCVPEGNNVSVPCPKLPSSAEVKFNLLKDEEIIFNHPCSPGREALNHALPHASVELHDAENKTVSFMLTGVNASSHGFYRCEAIVMFPPPVCTARDATILVLLEGQQCNKVCRSDTTGGDQSCGIHWIWITILVSTYSVIVTIIAIITLVKLRRTDFQSDYVNTKPKAPRERRGKRGLQIPIPRHF